MPNKMNIYKFKEANGPIQVMESKLIRSQKEEDPQPKSRKNHQQRPRLSSLTAKLIKKMLQMYCSLNKCQNFQLTIQKCFREHHIKDLMHMKLTFLQMRLIFLLMLLIQWILAGKLIHANIKNLISTMELIVAPFLQLKWTGKISPSVKAMTSRKLQVKLKSIELNMLAQMKSQMPNSQKASTGEMLQVLISQTSIETKAPAVPATPFLSPRQLNQG